MRVCRAPAGDPARPSHEEFAMTKKALSIASAAALLLGFLAVAQPASASTLISVTCTGTNVINYSPGLTNTPQTVTISGQDTAVACVDLARPLTQLSFVAPFSGTFTTSCTALLAGGTGTQTFHWNTGETSNWNWTLRFSNTVNGQLLAIADGPITSGLYAGAQVRQVITETTGDQTACFTPEGMTQNGGPSNWVITNLL
ncbi:hypothetical protein D7I43_24610 [Micromonospora globbae]|uniref:Uncharacterized protein n=2 Tax=Micromonospora globbae TaxID=1894969 RepID=A0A420EVN2_9ACTN|nr:hypothetical protein D7I43_24610 [Micromonospora globbae]